MSCADMPMSAMIARSPAGAWSSSSSTCTPMWLTAERARLQSVEAVASESSTRTSAPWARTSSTKSSATEISASAPFSPG